MSAVIVIPTYNERDNLELLLERVFEEVPDVRVLIVDDNSPDGTGELADSFAEREPDKVSVLHRSEKQGLGAAYVAGYTHALEQWPDTDFFVQMDADLSHDPKYLRPMLEAAEDADLVVGSRYTRGVSIVNWPLSRLIISKLGTAYARIVTGLPITDCTSGFKCYRAGTLRAINLEGIRSNGYCFQIETSFRVWQQGLRVKDLPIIFYERQRGKSKLNLSIALEAFIVVARLGLGRLLHRRP
ncbi:MAG: polyprenol monophosphomannose synthase [Candidatus Hydrogenedentes bacterium]|nr:polyprenol monophosphomannose synthase [Candidatus Hydrogenedentota bacterium]